MGYQQQGSLVMLESNIILMTDSYKASHSFQYPPGTQYVHSYIESRGGLYDQTLFFGLQMFLKKYLSKPITREMVIEAKEFFDAHGEPFDVTGWNIIVDELGGKLPIVISAVPEGMVVPTGNVLMTIQNTDPRFPWLTSYMETMLLRAIWYPTTVATQSWNIKRVIKAFLEKTSDNPEAVLPFRLHDFGARGVSSPESAEIGGAAHLVNFMGSDTVEGILAARRYYGEPMAAYSIPAMEHSTVTSWGRDGEVAAYENAIDKFDGPGKIFAIVSDSYDLFYTVEHIWGGVLKEKVQNLKGTLVVRPDSGDPVEVPVRVVKMLADIFGTTTNSKGFKVLPNFIKVIQGDGINQTSITAILTKLMEAGLSAENIAFGMGGALLQHVNRDTQRFAMKASAVNVNGEWRGVSKAPATDMGKRSKEGQLALIRDFRGFQTVPLFGHAYENLLQQVWRNGDLRRDQTFAEIRAQSVLGV